MSFGDEFAKSFSRSDVVTFRRIAKGLPQLPIADLVKEKLKEINPELYEKFGKALEEYRIVSGKLSSTSARHLLDLVCDRLRQRPVKTMAFPLRAL